MRISLKRIATARGVSVQAIECQLEARDDGELAKPCESRWTKCDYPATYMVWCDHHIQGCDYTGYRCDVHRNLLELESRRQLDAIRAGIHCVCFVCDAVVVGTNLSDHFRWMKL